MGPDPAVAQVRAAVRAALARRSEPLAPVLVACSGGSDSLALAAALAFEAPRADVPAGLITIDHGLWPGAYEQAQRVAAIGYELGLTPVQLVRVEVGSAGGPEAAARHARYEALAAAGTDVLLGHTLDDQAETVLLGLGRGSGPRSIAGMRAVDGHWLRPLLGLRRAVTVQACVALGLTPWDDPANHDPRYQRVRLRREVLPLLEDVLQGGVAGALARTASLVRDDLEALDQLAEARLAEALASPPPASASPAPAPASLSVAASLPVAALTHEPPAIRTRMLRSWALAGGVSALSAAHIARLDELVVAWHGQDAVALPGGYTVDRRSGTLRLHPDQHRMRE
jgi:tRNA(Ile)-lysidine synthase